MLKNKSSKMNQNTLVNSTIKLNMEKVYLHTHKEANI